MPRLSEHIPHLGEKYGVLAESNTHQLKVIANNTDIAVGDMFLLPCQRGPDRFYIFRTTEYANILNRSLEMNDIARNKLTMPDSYLAEDLSDEKLIELTGMVLGYAQWSEPDQWTFHRPRRLPQHLSDVYHVEPSNPSVCAVILELMQSQLGTEGLYVGDLLAGEQALSGVPVYLPISALSHHIGVFGRTGCGKSNLMMVLLRSIMKHNHAVRSGTTKGPPASILAIDPHDEFRTWHATSGGADGIRGIVNSYDPLERDQLVAPFYYLTARNVEQGMPERRLQLSRADLTPSDLFSVMEFSEQQTAFANQFYAIHGERWISHLLMGDTGSENDDTPDFLPGTISAVQRRLSGLQFGNTRVFTRFDAEAGIEYDSLLPDIICSLEQGRLLVVDTTLMTELEQFLVTTVVARTLFAIRKALRTAESADLLADAIRLSVGNDDVNNQIGMRSLANQLCKRLSQGDLPYITEGSIRSIEDLPRVNVVVEEAPSILNPARMKFGSVFRDISRQGRKFGIGMTVVSQQVSEIDSGILTQINSELNMSLGNDVERREAIRNASVDLLGFEQEMKVLSRGQVIVSASYKDVPLPVQVPAFDGLEN